MSSPLHFPLIARDAGGTLIVRRTLDWQSNARREGMRPAGALTGSGVARQEIRGIEFDSDPDATTRQARRGGLERAAMADQHGQVGHQPGRSHVALQAMRSRVQPGSFPLLLVTLLLLYVLDGVAVDLPANAIVGRVAVACAGLSVLRANPTTLWLGSLVVAFWLTFEARLWTLDRRVSRILQDTMRTGFVLWVLVVVLREVFRPARARWTRSSGRCAASCSSSWSS